MRKADSQLASRMGRGVARPIDKEAEKRRGWRNLGIFVVDISDQRLSWADQKLVEELGDRLYGKRS
jgi:hypothetical protein